MTKRHHGISQEMRDTEWFKTLEGKLEQLAVSQIIEDYDISYDPYYLGVQIETTKRFWVADPIMVDGEKHYNVIPLRPNEARMIELHHIGDRKRWVISNPLVAIDEARYVDSVPRSALRAYLTERELQDLALEYIHARYYTARVPSSNWDYFKHWLVKTFPLMTAPFWQPKYDVITVLHREPLPPAYYGY